MSSEHILVAHVVKALVFFALAGILVRRRTHLCWSFVVYLVTVLISNSLVSFWPERYFKQWFWILTHGLFDALSMGIAVELGYRTFQAFPRAQATARRAVFSLLCLTSVALIGVPMAATYQQVLLDWQPRVLAGTIWIMTGLALLITWYRVPVHPYHKAILLGHVPYLLVFTTLLSLTQRWGWAFFGPYLQAGDPVAYMLLTGFWASAAWRRDAQPAVSPALLHRLQPWRVGA